MSALISELASLGMDVVQRESSVDSKTYKKQNRLKCDLITKVHAPVKRATNGKYVGAENCAFCHFHFFYN